jgi:hypothetical protein
MGGWVERVGCLPVDPPGCSSRKSVTSHTWLSTTTQQSSGVLWFETCWTETSFWSVILGGYYARQETRMGES